MNGMEDLKRHLGEILTPELCMEVYRLKFPWEKGNLPSGAVEGQSHFKPSADYIQAFYNLIFHHAIKPLSQLPLDSVLSVDLSKLLPNPNSPEYPEHCLGMITLLDQTRVFTTGYGFRYTRAFFDPICEQLVRQLVSLPANIRPDGKQAWLSRDYTLEDWLVRTLWFWAPLVHSDVFMTADRELLKEWLHNMRSEVEYHAAVSDPFASMEPYDDVDINAFKGIMTKGPPSKSYFNSDNEAAVSDYAFWWIRILNSHFAITDMCGHYPYWVRWTGLEWTEEDKEFMEKTDNFQYDPANEPILQQVRNDYLDGVWKPLQPNLKYEKEGSLDGRVTAPGGQVLQKRILGERGHRPRVRGAGSSRMPP